MFYPRPHDDVTIAPFARTIGHEVEYSSGVEIARRLQEAGYGTPGTSSTYRLHGYGCDCNESNNYAVHCTSDSTAAGGEYLIGGNRGVLFGSPFYMEATRVLSDAAIAVGCGTSTSVGMHTHVGLANPDGRGELTTGQRINILRIYWRYFEEIKVLAAGALPENRSNSCTPGDFDMRRYWVYAQLTEKQFWDNDENQIRMSMPMDGHLRIGTNHNTVEFRVWNSTKAQWRMVLAGAISAAMVQAAYENRRAHPDNPATLTEFLKGLLTPDVVMLVDRQRKAKGLVDA